jgi:hypothetical protein
MVAFLTATPSDRLTTKIKRQYKNPKKAETPGESSQHVSIVIYLHVRCLPWNSNVPHNR